MHWRDTRPRLHDTLHHEVAVHLRNVTTRPQGVWVPVPNGGLDLRQIKRLERQGQVIFGAPDLVFIPRGGLVVELKTERSPELRDAQLAYAQWCAEEGVLYLTAREWPPIRDALEQTGYYP